MKRPTSRSVLCLAPLLLAACGSVPTKTFVFDAITVDERPLPCLVVVGDDWVGAAERGQLINVDNKDDTLSLALKFDRAQVDVTVAAIEVNPDTGKPERIPRSRLERSDYVAEPRQIQLNDPQKQLFILPRK
jgi:hypothetical protein